MATSTGSKSKRVIRFMSAIYFDAGVDPITGNDVRTVRTGLRGQEVELLPDEEKRLDGLGALLKKGAKPEDAESEREAILDLYRGQRGDAEAMQRAHARAGKEQVTSSDVSGGIVDVSTGGGIAGAAPEDRGNVGQLADHISQEKLSIDDTVALAGDDASQARRVLEAEHLASGGSPRKGVEDRLQKIIKG